MSSTAKHEFDQSIRDLASQLRNCRVADECPHCDRLIRELIRLATGREPMDA